MAKNAVKSKASDKLKMKDIESSVVSNVDQSPTPSKVSTQSRIGLYYVSGFLIIIAGVVLITLFRCYPVVDIKDLLLALSGILSGPLGFIIGFYFKEDIQNKNI